MELLPWLLASVSFLMICWFADDRAKLLKQLKNARHDKLALSHNVVALQRENDFIRNDHAVAEEYIDLLKHSSACPSCQEQQDRTKWHERPVASDRRGSYYEALVNECHEIRATIALKQNVH
jgi:hypothetical protein